jgi:hypothetical protein
MMVRRFRLIASLGGIPSPANSDVGGGRDRVAAEMSPFTDAIMAIAEAREPYRKSKRRA